MKKLISLLLLLLVNRALSQSIEFDKKNFPDRKDEFKEAKRKLEEGMDAFSEGKKYYDEKLVYYIQEYKYAPVSRNDYSHSGEDKMSEALPNLLEAQKFNPENDFLNYAIGFSYFHTDHQKETCIPFLEKAFMLNPSVAPDISYILAWAYQLHYKWDKAIKFYSVFLEIMKNDKKLYPIWAEDINKKIQECKTGQELMNKPERVFIDNLGVEINSKFPDYSALINADASMLIFTSRRNNSTGGKTDPETGSYFEDLYVSYRKSGKWSTAVNMGAPINTEEHDATSGLSPDGTTLYIYEFKEKDGGDIYESKLNGSNWSKPEHMNKNINSKAHESTVSESFDGKLLYFISDKEGGIGNRDIYVSAKDLKGEWGVATNLGSTLNTKYAEEGIFIHPDGKSMYFSSKGHNTMGGYDIFKSTYENGKWSSPVNLGYPINSPDDDVFFVISGSGRHGYYASAKDEGSGEKDLYMITFLGPEKSMLMNNEDNLIASVAEPVKNIEAAGTVQVASKALTILKGEITDAFTNRPLETNIELVDNSKNEVIANFKSNSQTGKYLIMLPSGKNYGIAVKKEGYLFHSENFDIPLSSGFQEVIKDIQLKNIAVGSKIVLKNIFFDFDKATLRPESTNEIERLAKLLTDVPTLKIEISGHTDNFGSDDYNLKLSQSRTESVVNQLIKLGIANDRLVAKGYGETKPIAKNDTDEGRQLNRRTEFEIIAK